MRAVRIRLWEIRTTRRSQLSAELRFHLSLSKLRPLTPGCLSSLQPAAAQKRAKQVCFNLSSEMNH